jgi:hypothetical protein
MLLETKGIWDAQDTRSFHRARTIKKIKFAKKVGFAGASLPTIA